ncbi:YaaC family protein [Actinomycetes bacterium KLBMP 9797]
MEQAEQLFAASTTVDYSARPILLFYGLSQAGRAVAAASTSAGSQEWRLSKHGIEARNLPQKPLYKVTVADQGWGSFTQLAALLDSGSLPKGAPLGDIWATLPDIASIGLGTADHKPKPALRFSAEDDSHSKYQGAMVGWVRGVPWPSNSWPTEPEIIDYLSTYPTLAGSDKPNLSHRHEVDPDALGHTRHDPYDKIADFLRAWPLPPGLDPWDGRTVPYRGDDDRWAFPVLGGSDRPLHPLLAWWAVLFALSMLARYEPASWTEHLDVDSSPDAVALETALERALDTCPELILQTMRRVSR